jgi:hypothetical protein
MTSESETRLPLLAASADGKGGNLPTEQAGITTSRASFLLK